MTQKVGRIKYYEDNLSNASIYTSNSDATTERSMTNKTVLLDRQFAPIIYNVDRDLENNLRTSDICNSNRREHYNYDNIEGIGSHKQISNLDSSKNINKMKSDFLIDQPEMAEQVKSFNKVCSERRRNLDWSSYRAPAKQIGHGIGNPDNYSETYIGQDSRLRSNQQEIELNPRNVDLELRSMVPLDGFKINYSGVPYDQDIRSGMQTRTQKKIDTQFNDIIKI